MSMSTVTPFSASSASKEFCRHSLKSAASLFALKCAIPAVVKPCVLVPVCSSGNSHVSLAVVILPSIACRKIYDNCK